MQLKPRATEQSIDQREKNVNYLEKNVNGSTACQNLRNAEKAVPRGKVIVRTASGNKKDLR